MENNTFPGGGIPQSKSPTVPTPTRSIGTGEGEVPLAPPIQNVTMRTMGSDIKSMQQSGGGAPTPYTPQVSSMPPRPPAPPAPPTNLPSGQFGAPQFGGGIPQRPPVVTPPSIRPQPQAPQPMPPTSQFPPEAPKKSGHAAVTGIIVFLVIVALGLAGYFFVYPYLSPSTPVVTPPAAVTTPPPVTTPEVTQQPIVPPPEVPTHSSLFNIAADATTEAQLRQLTPDTLKTAIQFSTAEVPILKEIVIRTGEPDGGGTIEPFNRLAQMFAPLTFNPEIVKSFESDFTFFIYTDKTGSWPGIIAKPKADATIATLKTSVQNIETSGEAKGFYLSDPGTTTGWKDGKINSLVTRYASFSQTGASFNYAWLPNNSLLMSTSYTGMKEAVNRLGY
ncbi:MAG: hypothetical protein Q7R98_01630 [Candidatus Jorgensenbacteria bacterium]|nr:hypothetical protein [Candidatus Jorgensenbacteria bacterium]